MPESKNSVKDRCWGSWLEQSRTTPKRPDLLHAAGQPSRGLQILDQRPPRPLPKVKFEHAGIDQGDPGVWVADYHLLDRLVAPLQLALGKA